MAKGGPAGINGLDCVDLLNVEGADSFSTLSKVSKLSTVYQRENHLIRVSGMTGTSFWISIFVHLGLVSLENFGIGS